MNRADPACGGQGTGALGNIWKNATSGATNFQPGIDASTNRIGGLGTQTWAYDSNGNLTSTGTGIGSASYTWDADGRMLTDSQNGYTTVNLTYDFLGRMVEQARGSSYTQIVYGPTGSKLALMNGQTLVKAFVPLPAGGTAVYAPGGLSLYRHPDWLGSSRFASTPARTMYYDGAYAPYGETYAEAGAGDHDFTGQNVDTTWNLYDFLYRGYDLMQGRWISPDPAGLAAVDITNPQSWNRYAYVENNPTNFFDPLGLDSIKADYCDKHPRVCNGFNDAVGSTPPGLGLFGVDEFDLAAAGLLPLGPPSAALPGCGAEFVTCVPTNGGTLGFDSSGVHDLPGNIQDCEMGDVCTGITSVTIADTVDLLKNVPFSVSGFIPLVRVPRTGVTVGAAGSLSGIPGQGVGCVAGGVGAAFPPTKGVSGGPLIHGNLANAKSILSGWSISLTLQPTFGYGYQVIANSSGVLGGPTVGTTGVSLQYTTAACKDF